jgi:hypothetical protein
MNMSVTKRQIATTLRQSAKLIDDRGWLQGRNGNRESGFCAIGALNEAVRGHCDQWWLYVSARKALSACTGTRGVMNFNDTPGRTKEEVTKLIRSTARALEHGMAIPEGGY